MTAEKAYATRCVRLAWVVCGTINVSQAPHTYRHLHYSVLLQSLPPAQAHPDDQPILSHRWVCHLAYDPVFAEPNKCPAVFTYALKDVHLSVYQSASYRSLAYSY